MKLLDMLTESDNSTIDAIRVLALVSVIIGLALQIWVVVRWFGPAPQPFDFQNFGIGVGALFGGVGVALKLKPESQA
jgi:hypothetical protein